MTLFRILFIGILTILISEWLGRGKVIYARLLGLTISYLAVTVSVLAFVSILCADSPEYLMAIFLSTLPIMSAWIGFRIHLSNSITLRLVSILDERKAKAYRQIMEEYNPQERIAKRLQNLKMASYLTSDSNEDLTGHWKPRLVYRLITFLRSP